MKCQITKYEVLITQHSHSILEVSEESRCILDCVTPNLTTVFCMCVSDIGCFHTTARTNRLAFVCLIWIYVILLSTCSSQQTNCLGKIGFPDSQISDNLFGKKFVCSVFTSDNLSVQMICSSSSVKTAIDFVYHCILLYHGIKLLLIPLNIQIWVTSIFLVYTLPKGFYVYQENTGDSYLENPWKYCITGMYRPV